LQERYVREWLGAMVAGGIFEYEPASGSYELPHERAELLSGSSARNIAPMSQALDHFGKHLSALAECFRSGGGVPYSEFRPEFTERMDDLWRRIYDEQLVDGFLGAAPGLPERLHEGILVADIGCGTGHAANLMAREYPTSRFVGYDIGEDAIAAARREAQVMGLANVRFEVLDVRQLPTKPRLDLITGFDAIHDQAQPDSVLRSVHAALGDDGTFFDRLQVLKQPRSQPQQSLRGPLLRDQHNALPDRLPGRGRRRTGHRVGDGARALDAWGRRVRPCRHRRLAALAKLHLHLPAIAVFL
jgi:SAM-dependent methyltransferase